MKGEALIDYSLDRACSSRIWRNLWLQKLWGERGAVLGTDGSAKGFFIEGDGDGLKGCHTDSEGNVYDLAVGMNFSRGVQDGRVRRYGRR